MKLSCTKPLKFYWYSEEKIEAININLNLLNPLSVYSSLNLEKHSKDFTWESKIWQFYPVYAVICLQSWLSKIYSALCSVSRQSLQLNLCNFSENISEFVSKINHKIESILSLLQDKYITIYFHILVRLHYTERDIEKEGEEDPH